MNLGLELHADALDRLPANLKTVLAAACTQRQAEIFRIYAGRAKAKTSHTFDEILDSVWRDESSRAIPHRELVELEILGKKLMPSNKVRHSIYQANAECAVISLLRCIRVRISGQTRDVILAAAQSFDSIDSFLTNPIGRTPEIDIAKPGADILVANHPLMLAEHQRQEKDLSELQEAATDPSDIADAIDKIRNRAVGDEKAYLPIIEES
jgi:hypothetical protein